MRLFNARGTGPVTTHAIAAEAGLSPGNLYYHYPDKLAVIRDIVSRMPLLSPDQWRREGPENPRANFVTFLRFVMGNVETHRFAFREHAQLMQEDPALARIWRTRHADLGEGMREAAAHWVKLGVMRPFADAEALTHFIDTFWIVCLNASSHWESFGPEKARTSFPRAIASTVSFLLPYHTTLGKRVLQNYAAGLI